MSALESNPFRDTGSASDTKRGPSDVRQLPTDYPRHDIIAGELKNYFKDLSAQWVANERARFVPQHLTTDFEGDANLVHIMYLVHWASDELQSGLSINWSANRLQNRRGPYATSSGLELLEPPSRLEADFMYPTRSAEADDESNVTVRQEPIADDLTAQANSIFESAAAREDELGEIFQNELTSFLSEHGEAGIDALRTVFLAAYKTNELHWSALELIAKYPNKSTLRARRKLLIDALGSEDPGLRYAAAEILSFIRGETSTEALRRRLPVEQNPGVKAMIRAQLRAR